MINDAINYYLNTVENVAGYRLISTVINLIFEINYVKLIFGPELFNNSAARHTYSRPYKIGNLFLWSGFSENQCSHFKCSFNVCVLGYFMKTAYYFQMTRGPKSIFFEMLCLKTLKIFQSFYPMVNHHKFKHIQTSFQKRPKLACFLPFSPYRWNIWLWRYFEKVSRGALDNCLKLLKNIF